MARKVQEDWEAEEDVKKLADEKAEKAALSNEYDFIQARIKADRLLALRLQDEEREQFTMEERAKFLHDTIAAQRKFLAEQRVIAIRNRPPTRTQLRNQMMTYLKHVGNKKHSDLKNKTFEEIKALYEKMKRFDESFTAVGSTEDERKIKEMNKGAKDPEQKSLKKRVVEETPKKEDTDKVPAKVDVTEQGTKKRKGGHIKMIVRKKPRQQLDVDSEDEHRECLKIVTFEGTIDSEIMERKSVIEVDQGNNTRWRLFALFCYLQSQWELQGIQLSIGGIELILWGDLKIMMESSKEENDQKLEDGIVIHMLVERRYKEVLMQMLKLKLESEEDSTMALELIRFIKKLLAELEPEEKGFSTHLASVVKSWLVHDQTVHALASPKANELTIPEQMATGKGTSNPLMAGSLPKTTKPTNVPNDVIKLMMFPYSLEGAAKTCEAWERFKEMLRACPHHGFTELTQVDTFYNGLNDNDQDSLNAAAGGNLLSKTTREALNIIENKSKVRYSRNKPNASRMNTTSRENVSKTDERIDKLADQLSTLVEIVSKKVVTPAPVKAVEETCVTCGGAHSWYNCPNTDNNQSSVCATTDTPIPNDKSVNRIDIIDAICEEYIQEFLGFYNSLGGNPTPTSEPFTSKFILEEIEAYLKDDSISPKIDHAYCDPEEDILTEEKSSIEEPPELELKDLPSHLEYAYLEENDKLPVIIAKGLKNDEKDALLKVLKSHKRAIAWKITDMKGIDPRFCTHKILMEDDYKPMVQSQRRVNPKIHKVIKKEVLKLLDAGMIYPISDSPWVSLVHCVAKKGGIIVVANEENELILHV
ncbi:hypothetical protein Tco_0390272 [Tanacetum coccineum]